jgi:hypothetical protein
MPVSLRAFHWHPVRSTKKIASIAERSGTRGLWQPSGCFGRGGSSGSILAHSASGSRQPSSRMRRLVRFRAVLPAMRRRWGPRRLAPTGICFKGGVARHCETEAKQP